MFEGEYDAAQNDDLGLTAALSAGTAIVAMAGRSGVAGELFAPRVGFKPDSEALDRLSSDDGRSHLRALPHNEARGHGHLAFGPQQRVRAVRVSAMVRVGVSLATRIRG